VPYERFTPWLTQFAPAEALVRRHRIVHQFFRTADGNEAKEIAQELRARFLCLYGADRVRFDDRRLLDPVHEEPGARCYRLRWDVDVERSTRRSPEWPSVGEDDVRMKDGARRQLAAR